MPDDSYFARDTAQILEGYSTTLSAGDEIEYTSREQQKVRRSIIPSILPLHLVREQPGQQVYLFNKVVLQENNRLIWKARMKYSQTGELLCVPKPM